jgi:hypothetical protein
MFFSKPKDVRNRIFLITNNARLITISFVKYLRIWGPGIEMDIFNRKDLVNLDLPANYKYQVINSINLEFKAV